MTKICCVIPARVNSSRLNKKLLKRINGEYLIEYVRKRVLEAFNNKHVFVATADKEIFKIIKKNNGNLITTNKSHRDGTSRVSEAIQKLDYSHVIIVQGDEPFISAKLLKVFKSKIKKHPKIKCWNYISVLNNKRELDDENTVKCTISKNDIIKDAFRLNKKKYKKIYKLQGVFAFEKNFLLNLHKITNNKRQKKEKIEQLRIILSKHKIKAIVGDEDYISVNTSTDLIKVKNLLKSKKNEFK